MCIKNLALNLKPEVKGNLPVSSKDDELFIDVILPDGWKKESTDHPMWSKVLDGKGRERMTVFYKAAFYDREAFINVNKRFNFSVKQDAYRNDLDTYESINQTTFWGEVEGTVIFKTEEMRFLDKYVKNCSNEEHRDWWSKHSDFEKSIKIQCETFLETNYPNYQDVFAYWND